MSRYIDANALLKDWGIELPKEWPVKGERSKEVLAFMQKYENHPYYFAILSIYLTEPADVVPKEEYDALKELYARLLESACILSAAVDEYQRREENREI